jgi:MFS family permease
VSDYARLLRNNPDFTRLWLAQVVSLLGDWFNTIVMSALVSKYSGGSGLAVSAFLLARFIPPLVIGPFAGVLADRFDRKKLLIFSDVSRAIVVLLLLFTTTPDRLWLIYVLTIIQFALSSVFDPGRNAIMPNLLRQEDLVSANTLSSVTWSAMLAVGAIVGGVVAAVFGTSVALLIDSASFAISALLISQIKSRKVQAVPHKTKEGASEQGLIDGLRYAVQHPSTAVVLLVKLGQSLGNVDALMIIYATELFVIGEGGTTSLSIMYAAFGMGAVVGPIILNRFNDGSVRVMRRLIIIGFVSMTLGWLVFSGASSLVIVAVALILRAMGGSSTWTYSSVILQKSVPDRFLGRIFSLDMVGFQLASVISTLTTGLLVDSFGTEHVRQIVLGMGVVSLLPLVLWTLLVPRLEKYETQLEVASAGD